jgi:hypothetical protein
MTEVCLATLPQCTEQEVFDHVVRGLASQGFERSMDQDLQRCQYRGMDGAKCAGGWVMTDDEYRPEYDIGKQGWDDLITYQGLPEAHSDLIYQLQEAHDSGIGPTYMCAELRRVADTFDLSAAVLDA